MEQHQQQAVPPQFSVDVNPTPAANPTAPQLTSSHPSYAEMITSAIMWDSSQGKAGGSSKRAIAKYIDRVYTNLPPTHSALLTHHLKRLKNSGNLVMIKNSYQLPVVAASASSPPVPVRSAQPQPQPQPQFQPQPQPQFQPQPQPQPLPHYEEVSATPKKRPGRPPKAKPLDQPANSPPVSSGNGPSTGKRPRGRPPRQQQPAVAVAEVPFGQPQAQPVYVGPDSGLNNGEQPVKKRPGRPPKRQQQPVYESQLHPSSQNLVTVPVNGEVPRLPKRRPGRPLGAKNVVAAGPTAPVVVGVRSRGRPKRNALALAPVSRPIGKRPRGRPPRNPAAVPGGRVGGGKRRGRPSKGSGAAVPPKPVRKYTGKPRGRPRKSASIGGMDTSDQAAANEELMRKVAIMQATVRDAVGVLRPYLPEENTAEVLAALQQLEAVSTMDLNAFPASIEPTAMSVNGTVHVQPSTSVPVPVAVPETVSAAPHETVEEPNMDEPTMDEPPVVPYSITETAPSLYAEPSSGIEIHQPTSWIPSSQAQL